jgi:manganese/iron transport system permease protein
MMVLAAIVGVISVWLGLTISYHFGTAASATMALVPIVLFFALLGLKNATRTLTRAVAR